MCIFETTLSTYGFCQSILSMSDDTPILPEYKVDMTAADSGAFVYQQDYEKVCRSVYVNTTSGRCVEGLLSKNKVRLLCLKLSPRVVSVCQTLIAPQLILLSLLPANAVTPPKVLSTVISKVVTLNGPMQTIW